MFFKEWMERLEKEKIEVPYTIIFFLKKEIVFLKMYKILLL